MKQKVLGKGLSALLTEAGAMDESSVQEIRISDIDPNLDQPRKSFDDEALQQLALSIRNHGIVQPILVKPQEGRYMIIAGERRWRAARMAGLTTIPVLVKDYQKKEIMEIALIENLQRQDLNPVEEAHAIRSLMEEHQLTQEQVSEKIGKSRSAIANMLRLLQLSTNILMSIQQGTITAGHARALLSIENMEIRNQIADRIVLEELSVRETETIVKKITEKKDRHTSSKVIKKNKEQYYDIETTLGQILGTKVRINGNFKKGKIEIDYYNSDDLDRLYEMITILSRSTGQ